MPKRWSAEWRPRWLAMLLLVFAGWTGGCSLHVTPPPEPQDPVLVYVALYGRHASLVLPVEETHMVEYAWGDWQYFALGDNSLADGLEALFFSRGSTLGRRYLAQDTEALHLRQQLQAQRLLPLTVERTAARGLRTQLDRRYARHQATEIKNPAYAMNFVRDEKSYNLFYNSTHELVAWLRALDCQVSGYALEANFKLREPRVSEKRHVLQRHSCGAGTEVGECLTWDRGVVYMMEY